MLAARQPAHCNWLTSRALAGSPPSAYRAAARRSRPCPSPSAAAGGPPRLTSSFSGGFRVAILITRIFNYPTRFSRIIWMPRPTCYVLTLTCKGLQVVPMPVAMTGGSSGGGGGRVLDCRSFWKAGAYEAPAAPSHEFQGSSLFIEFAILFVLLLAHGVVFWCQMP